MLGCVGLTGLLWGGSNLPETSRDLFGSVLRADLARATLYGLALLIPASLVITRLRHERFRLGRGIALAFALCGGHALLAGNVLTPGVGIISSLPDGRYAEFGGTSMAVSHVVGLVALLWSANPALIGDINRTEQIITETARYTPTSDLCGAGTSNPNNVSGFGVVDALEAVRMALERP